VRTAGPRFFFSRLVWAVFFGAFFSWAVPVRAQDSPRFSLSAFQEKEVTLDFNDVDLPVLVKLISELTGKNFVIDEKVRGKVSIISPTKIPLNRVFEVFLSVLELKGLTVSQSGGIYQIRPFTEMPTPRSVHVYVPQNMKAEEIAKVLRGLVAKPAARGRQVRPKKSKKGRKELTAQVQILSDKESNSLIITATDSDYEVLKEVIGKLDRKRRQIYVEAVILDLDVSKNSQLGTDLGLAFAAGGDQVGVFGGLNNTIDVQGLTGLKSLLGGEIPPVNISAVLNALKQSDDVNILSTPQIMTSDNQKAEIVIADNVPFPGANSQTVGGNVQTTIERKDVGIILRITPNILEDDRVELDVYQEISNVTNAGSSGPDSLGPTTRKRSASTTVVIRSGQTIVIGGLIKDEVEVVERKIPLLGDIPLLGWLFRFEGKRIKKGNLMIFLTPHIIDDDEDLEEIRAKKTQGADYFMEDNFQENQAERAAVFGEMVNLPR